MKNKIHHYFIPQEQNNFRPHLLRPHFLSFFSVLVIFAKFFVTAAFFVSYSSPTAFAAITSRQIIEFTNQARQEAGLAPLSENFTLDRAAMQKAQDMLDRGYFNHEDPDGNPPWYWLKNNGYLYSYAGENLAMDFIKAESVHQAWMNSESHRANILNPSYQEIGIGVLQGELQGKKTTVLVQFFGTTFAQEETNYPFATSLEQGSPLATELTSGLNQPQFKGEEITVTLKSEPEHSLLSKLVAYTQEFYWAILGLLSLLLLINILVKIKVQHKSIIVQTILVLILIATMISLQTHFLENISQTLKII
ncbi:MAG: hypothetical protein COY66_01145 [Candidatus Kerfeldbacteria bacterium CG_4_10_14_0_8_um_filter_42_10]|uniref:SCP domain-containing protein n=1 Tax=Candidatus Kerfeldbacteria bacterium CG_4_10_14_0_8_um_filter_42_10 TaxID=2014248 RepID=A0A2M7RL61_9BACT|nr:MAG: hypothetical protein COY66_01145 [Candidatus Kerfeldbacteria bacterium CG_4_10_14_0_8_um_filter_42_10]